VTIGQTTLFMVELAVPRGRVGYGRLAQVTKERLRRWWAAYLVVLTEALAGFVSLGLLMLGLVLSPLMLFTGGWLIAPRYVALLRWWAAHARTRVGRYADRPVNVHYPPIPDRLSVEGRLGLVFDRSTGRDVRWLAAHGVVGTVVALVGAALPIAALNTLLIPGYWYLLPAESPVGSLYPVTSWGLAATMPLLALGYAAISWWLIPAMARGITRAQEILLTPSRTAHLAERVTALTASRAAALSAHSAELRRIERDLHDGAQNRLVSVVMMLGIAERALETNPATALPLVRRAQDAATDALAGLRTTVHDIYPPILDELGLEGALSAVAGRSAIPCVLDVGGLHRVPTAVESATYFVVAELLTNATKHSGAEQVRVRVESDFSAVVDRLLIVVADDGHGGAVERPAGGLAGIRRRVEAFEGTMRLTSPVGGPTTIEVELPCGW